MCFFANTGAAEKQSRKYSFFATVFCIYPFTDSRSYIQKNPQAAFSFPYSVPRYGNRIAPKANSIQSQKSGTGFCLYTGSELQQKNRPRLAGPDLMP